MDKRASRVLAAAVTRSKLEALFHLPLQEAATHVGIGRTLFKRVCRQNLNRIELFYLLGLARARLGELRPLPDALDA